MEEQIKTVQNVINYAFRDVKLLRTALTHSSFANEQGTCEEREAIEHNERLEFLGDAVLELCVTEELFGRFPEEREGELTRMRAKLVSKTALKDIALEMGLNNYLLLGKGEESQGGRLRGSLLSDALEAIIGAVFLDGGFDAARVFVGRLYGELWPGGPERRYTKDYKSALQEVTQEVYKERPVYTLVASRGPEHEKEFEVELTLPDGRIIRGQGPGVKKAEQEAAGKALKLLERENPR